MNTGAPGARRFADLGPRIASALVLAAIALLDLWLGGGWLVALAAIAAALMLWELHRMVTRASGASGLAPPPVALAVLGVAGAGTVIATAVWGLGAGVAVMLAGALATLALAAADARGWLVAGLVYIGLGMAYLTLLRDSELHGLPMVLWLVLVVVAADVGAYFTGRLLGGPKLWPAVSPGKTWSGAVGGLAAALAVGLVFGVFQGWALLRLAGLSLAVAVASQLGDLLESAVKRRFGVKDASRLIPGHGGLMDRLDGVMGALWLFALYDLAGGGFGGA
jgi:phosphatidate cytidylyltransferase